MIDLVKGKQYKFKHQDDVLIYVGETLSGGGCWHQFSLKGRVWCELKSSDLHLLEVVN